MNRCPETINVQDWLDGTLDPQAAARFEAHLAGCAECEAEVAAFRVVFAELRTLPLLDPRPELFQRIMEEVLPHRARTGCACSAGRTPERSPPASARSCPHSCCPDRKCGSTA
jgi:anti-sigma factor RsiW